MGEMRIPVSDVNVPPHPASAVTDNVYLIVCLFVSTSVVDHQASSKPIRSMSRGQRFKDGTLNLIQNKHIHTQFSGLNRNFPRN